MTNFEVVSTLEKYFQDNWIQTPVCFLNAPFSPPDNDPWVRFTVEFWDSALASLGTRCPVTLRGQIRVQVLVRRNTGHGPSLAVIDSAVALLQNKTIGGILTYESSIDIIGDVTYGVSSPKSDWFSTSVTTKFETA